MPLETGSKFGKIYCCHLNFVKSAEVIQLQSCISLLFMVIIGPAENHL